jgi:hypothetical protein
MVWGKVSFTVKSYELQLNVFLSFLASVEVAEFHITDALVFSGGGDRNRGGAGKKIKNYRGREAKATTLIAIA